MNNTLRKFRPGRASVRQVTTGCAFDVEEHRPGALKRAGQMVTSLWTELRREREKNRELRTHLKRSQEANTRYKSELNTARNTVRVGTPPRIDAGVETGHGMYGQGIEGLVR